MYLPKALAEAHERIKHLEASLTSANQRAATATNQAAAAEERAERAENARQYVSEQHAKYKQEKTRECEDLNYKILMLRAGREDKYTKLKTRVAVLESEVTSMTITMIQMRRNKGDAERQARESREQACVLRSRLEATYTSMDRLSRKRPLDDSGDEDVYKHSTRPAKRISRRLAEIVVPCTQCFPKGWPCDNGGGGRCRNCELRGKEIACKRVMCKNWERGECKGTPIDVFKIVLICVLGKKVDCTFAHEGDGFRHVINYTLLKVKKSYPSPVEREQQQQKKNKDAGDTALS
ncbi:hypothetical protein N0V90_001206 [Kalmusia sp. IMI 367209]|nr:hypothetical protein N0V90_001206 [Kalmusia sp. IMI 367209]